MTDPYGAPIDAPEVPADDTPEPEASTDASSKSASGRRGRPRSSDTLARDHDVLVKIAETDDGLSKAALVTSFDGSVKPSLVYLALYRLSRSGLIEKVAGAESRYTWRATDEGRARLAEG